ncbi:MAG: hypothetical protein ACLQVL_16985 [Terriglobia bacterium]
MRRLAVAILFTALTSVAQSTPLHSDLQSQVPASNPTAISSLVIPAGTTVSLALTNPIMSKTAKAGDSVYAETAFPVAVKNQMAIPAGTYVQGQIDTLLRPGWLSPHAQFQMHFTKIIFASGYTVELGGTQLVQVGQPPPGTPLAPPDDVIPAVANAYVLVSSASDVLLDNGTQFEMVLQIPLSLDAAKVAAAVRQSNPESLAQFRSATRCRPFPGSPGTPDTVIPGTPGTPGTPDIVIPGAPGTPPTVIPGTPATPGTPDTVLHGTPGTPYIPCPGPPVVTSNPKVQNYRESFRIDAPVQVSGKPLPAGSYQVTWGGSGPVAQVGILQDGKAVLTVMARVVLLNRKSSADTPGTQTNSDGSLSLQSLRFAGETFALYFDQGAL